MALVGQGHDMFLLYWKVPVTASKWCLEATMPRRGRRWKREPIPLDAYMRRRDVPRATRQQEQDAARQRAIQAYMALSTPAPLLFQMASAAPPGMLPAPLLLSGTNVLAMAAATVLSQYILRPLSSHEDAFDSVPFHLWRQGKHGHLDEELEAHAHEELQEEPEDELHERHRQEAHGEEPQAQPRGDAQEQPEEAQHEHVREDFASLFRVASLHDLQRLVRLLRLPATVTAHRPNGASTYSASNVDALALLLARLAFPGRLDDLRLRLRLNWSLGKLSPIIRATVLLLDERWSTRVLFDVRVFEDHDRLREFADAIKNAGCFKDCVGCIEGITLQLTKPGRRAGEEGVVLGLQDVLVSGRESQQCVRFQGIVTPDGMLASFFGPYPG